MKVESSGIKTVVAEEKMSRLNALITGVLAAYAITCIVLIGYALLITYGAHTGESMPLVVTVTSLVSVIVAGFDAAKGADSRGWFWGIVAGLIYAAILTAIGIWINRGFAVDSRTITLFVLSVAGGGFGGVIGINLGFMKKRKK